MFKKLFPRNDNFFTFFENHSAMIVKAAEALLLFGETEANYEKICAEIKSYEQSGDKITHQCIEALHRNFITPLERSDIHLFISRMDDVLDEIENVSKFMALYKLPPFPPIALKLASLLHSSCLEMQQCVIELRKMKNSAIMKRSFFNINNLENEADTVFMEALRALFEEETQVLTILKWKEIYGYLEEAIDACEDVANIVEGFVLEYD